MSVYSMNKILYLIENDDAFRQRMQDAPEAVVGEFPLTSDERKAFTSGDILALHGMGVHPFLLNNFSRHGLFGVTEKNYPPPHQGRRAGPVASRCPP